MNRSPVTERSLAFRTDHPLFKRDIPEWVKPIPEVRWLSQAEVGIQLKKLRANKRKSSDEEWGKMLYIIFKIKNFLSYIFLFIDHGDSEVNVSLGTLPAAVPPQKKISVEECEICQNQRRIWLEKKGRDRTSMNRRINEHKLFMHDIP